MACNCISNRCNSCRNFVNSTSVTLSGTNLVIAIPQNNYLNNSEVCICVSQSIPSGVTSDTTVVIQIGTDTATTYPLVNKCGHFVYGDQIRSRTLYCTKVATDTKAFIYNGYKCLPCTAHIFPAALPVSATTPASVNKTVTTK